MVTKSRPVLTMIPNHRSQVKSLQHYDDSRQRIRLQRRLCWHRVFVVNLLSSCITNILQIEVIYLLVVFLFLGLLLITTDRFIMVSIQKSRSNELAIVILTYIMLG
jgi:uncharacterized membrane protein